MSRLEIDQTYRIVFYSDQLVSIFDPNEPILVARCEISNLVLGHRGFLTAFTVDDTRYYFQPCDEDGIFVFCQAKKV